MINDNNVHNFLLPTIFSDVKLIFVFISAGSVITILELSMLLD